jgi:hypothetical protein
MFKALEGSLHAKAATERDSADEHGVAAGK